MSHVTNVTNEELMFDAILHATDKHHSRIKGYYVCGMGCCNQFIFHRPLQIRQCPICGRTLKLLSKVDEYEVERIKSYSNGIVMIEDAATRTTNKERRYA